MKSRSWLLAEIEFRKARWGFLQQGVSTPCKETEESLLLALNPGTVKPGAQNSPRAAVGDKNGMARANGVWSRGNGLVYGFPNPCLW